MFLTNTKLRRREIFGICIHYVNNNKSFSYRLQSSQVQVLPPADMNFPPSKVEAAIGSHLLLPIAVFAKVTSKYLVI